MPFSTLDDELQVDRGSVGERFTLGLMQERQHDNTEQVRRPHVERGPETPPALAISEPETIGPTQAMSRVTLKTNPVAVERTVEPNSSGR